MPSASETARTTVVMIFAFMGVESALAPSGEVKNPARTVPRAIFTALGIVTILYIALQVVTQGILGVELATNTKAPLAAAAKVVLGRGGELLVLLGAAISTFGYVAAGQAIRLNSSKSPFYSRRLMMYDRRRDEPP